LDLRQIPGSRDGILDGPRRISRKNGPIPNLRREWRSISKHGIRRWHQYLQALESQTLSPSAAILYLDTKTVKKVGRFLYEWESVMIQQLRTVCVRACEDEQMYYYCVLPTSPWLNWMPISQSESML
jgi:hypothetical protein